MAFTERERRVVFFGGLGALLILLYSLALDPILESNKKNLSEINRKSLLIKRFTSLLKKEGQVQEEFRVLSSQLSKPKKGLLASGSPAIAAADLQKYLNEAARRTHITIESAKVLEAFEESLFMVVPVEIVIKSNLRNVSRFLFEVENGKKFINVQYLKMRNTRKLSGYKEERIESKIIARGFYLNSRKYREKTKI